MWRQLYSKKHQVSSSKYGLRAVFQVILQGGQPAPPLRFPLGSSLCCRSTTISPFHKHASSSVFFSPFASLRVSLCVPSSGVLGSAQSENVFSIRSSKTQTYFGNTYTFLFWVIWSSEMKPGFSKTIYVDLKLHLLSLTAWNSLYSILIYLYCLYCASVLCAKHSHPFDSTR